MAKGDNTGIAQWGASLNPYGTPGGNAMMGPAFGSNLFGPSPEVLQMIFSRMANPGVPGQEKKQGGMFSGPINKTKGRLETIQQGIQRLKGNQPQQQKPQGMNRMPPPVQMMEGGGMFMLPNQRVNIPPAFQPNYSTQMPMQSGGMGLKGLDASGLMNLMNQSSGMRRFV